MFIGLITLLIHQSLFTFLVIGKSTLRTLWNDACVGEKSFSKGFNYSDVIVWSSLLILLFCSIYGHTLIDKRVDYVKKKKKLISRL